MTGKITHVWVYLAASPLLWLTLTLLAYQGAYWVYQRLNYQPLANPVPLSVAFLVGVLLLTHTDYHTYFDGAQFIHFLLGPATVALAIPLYAHLNHVRRLLIPLLGALVLGSATAILTAVGVAKALGASPQTLLSLAPKSVTTPIAMGISEKIGGLPALTAVFVILTGIIGSVSAKVILDLLKIKDHGVRGFSVGLAAHGLGTARAFQVSELAGAFSGMAMGLNGVVTAFLAPLLVKLFGLH